MPIDLGGTWVAETEGTWPSYQVPGQPVYIDPILKTQNDKPQTYSFCVSVHVYLHVQVEARVVHLRHPSELKLQTLVTKVLSTWVLRIARQPLLTTEPSRQPAAVLF